MKFSEAMNKAAKQNLPSDAWIEKRQCDMLFGRTKKVRQAERIAKQAKKLIGEGK